MSSVSPRPAPSTARLALALAGGLGILVLFELSPELQRLLEPLNQAVARATAWLLETLEMSVIREDTTLSHSDGFSYRIGYVCSGIRPLVLLGMGMLLVRATWAQRLAGIALAIVAIELVNFGRLIHLYWIGVNHPELYFATHRVLWNVIAIGAGIVYFGAWLRLSRTPVDKSSRLPTSRNAHP